ncbi:ABC transporter permease [Mycetocola spongiae]|uniref:ABC transporter permease n=1 Tax=Mycetocola spongiae TaxID=2859226 RepID=UPI001CF47B4C|nr:ABC transporter permease [Mycetocola spongiae]UCR90035.1 ABC transporter permease [Mycetocola spongiae]
MNAVLTLTHRNLRAFFRERMRVFFSLLAAIILVLLYVFFLGAQISASLTDRLPGAQAADIDLFMRSWVFAGVVMITTLTTSLGATSVFIEDRVSHRFDDFLISPLRRTHLTLGYLLSAFVISAIISLLILAIAQAYLLLSGGGMNAPQLLSAVGITLLCCASFSALSAFIASLISSEGAFSALSTLVGTISGFLAGAYVPFGALPAAVGNVMTALPFAQAATLMRGPLTENTLATLTDSTPGAGAEIGEYFGITASLGDLSLTPGLIVTYLIVLGVVFLGLASWRIGRSLR